VLGRCTYDDAFASIVGRDKVRGIQFHPEKSQEDGLRILRNFTRM
jgi:glutamine amidotransferase